MPVCYLRRWAGADGQLHEYKLLLNGPRRVVVRSTFPDGTGYQKDLYRIDGLPPGPMAQQFESTFMHMVDTEAAQALQRIVSQDQTAWPGELRSSWTRFLLGFLFRNPEAVAQLKAQMVEVWQAGLEGLRENYTEHRRPQDPVTFEEYVQRAPPDAPYRAALIMLQQIIDNDRVGPTIFDMHWSRRPLPLSRFALLTSDRPLIMPVGLGDDNRLIALPVSPRMLFVAAKDDRWKKKFDVMDQTEIAQRTNESVVQQARQFVWGVDRSQHRFVQNRIRQWPDRVLIKEDARQEAIAAARGLRWEDEGTRFQRLP